MQLITVDNVREMLETFQRIRAETDVLCLPPGLWEYSSDDRLKNVIRFRNDITSEERYWLVGNNSKGCPDYPEDRIAGIFVCRYWDMVQFLGMLPRPVANHTRVWLDEVDAVGRYTPPELSRLMGIQQVVYYGRNGPITFVESNQTPEREVMFVPPPITRHEWRTDESTRIASAGAGASHGEVGVSEGRPSRGPRRNRGGR